MALDDAASLNLKVEFILKLLVGGTKMIPSSDAFDSKDGEEETGALSRMEMARLIGTGAVRDRGDGVF